MFSFAFWKEFPRLSVPVFFWPAKSLRYCCLSPELCPLQLHLYLQDPRVRWRNKPLEVNKLSPILLLCFGRLMKSDDDFSAPLNQRQQLELILHSCRLTKKHYYLIAQQDLVIKFELMWYFKNSDLFCSHDFVHGRLRCWSLPKYV